MFNRLFWLLLINVGVSNTLALVSVFLGTSLKSISILFDERLFLIISVISLLLLIVPIVNFKKKLKDSQWVTQQEKFNLTQEFQNISENYKKIADILQNIPDGIISTDNKGIINLANKKALEILKTSWAEIGGRSISEILPLQNQVLKEGANLKLNMQSLDGEKMVVGIDALSWHDEKLAQGTIYVVRDITKESDFEEMKLDFVAMTAHQLRTPLTAIKGYLGLLEEATTGNAQKLNEEENLFLTRSIASSNRLSTLIENLLNISRIEKNHLKMTLNPLLIEEVIKEVGENVGLGAKQKGVSINLDFPTEPSQSLLGDKFLLEEALTNIVNNAIEYNHPGGWVRITLQKQADGITVHISDGGRGIPGSAMPHLFSKFFRVSNSLVQLSNGLGLGLYISKSIVEAHGGKIWANSLEGRGTTISLFLPFNPPKTVSSN